MIPIFEIRLSARKFPHYQKIMRKPLNSSTSSLYYRYIKAECFEPIILGPDNLPGPFMAELFDKYPAVSRFHSAILLGHAKPLYFLLITDTRLDQYLLSGHNPPTFLRVGLHQQ